MVPAGVLPSGVVSHYQSCLLMLCLSIGHVCWCGVLLSALSSGVVTQYRACRLVWSLTIGDVCWCDVYYYSNRSAITSDISANPMLLSDMPACTVNSTYTQLGSFIQICVFVNGCSSKQGLWFVINPSEMPTCGLPSWTPS